MAAPPLCRFDELGKFLFELLCRELLEVQPHRSALVAWIRPSRCGDDLERLRRAVAATDGQPLVLTNLAVPSEAAAELGVHVLDAQALSAIVLSQPQLLLRLPCLLGICPADAVLPADTRERSTGDVEAALALARTFVPTRAYAAAAAVVERHGFAVLTGPPEMGKTAIARMLGLAKLANGWELHECIRPEQLWKRYDRERAQVFVADDAFGSTEYRPEAAERWALDLDRVLRAMDERHWLVWTSRPAPLKSALRRLHREHGIERFPKPAQVHVDASDLDVAEKALILFRHARAAALPEQAVAAVRTHGWTVVSHRHFTPERIRRFVGGRLLSDLDLSEAAVAAEIREPTAAMAESFRALAPDHRALLVALLDVPHGPVAEHTLTAAVRRHSPRGIAQQPAALVDRLTDHFLRVGDAGAVTWVHPSWRDLVIDEVAGTDAARSAFLRACSLDGILLALSVGGGAGARALPLLVADADWDVVGDRLAELVAVLEPPDATRLLASLDAALADAGGVELDALATETLERLARRWERRHEPVPVGLLVAWAAARERVAAPPTLPDVTATWLQLAPGIDSGPAELADWLTLAELLARHDPGQLQRFAFPERYLGALRAILDRIGEREWVAPLRQLGDLVPQLSLRADGLIALLQARILRARAREETYVPRELPPDLETLLDAPPSLVGADERLVLQVLRDL